MREIVQVAAAEALGKIKDSRAIIPLISMLRNKRYLVRDKAFNALKNIGLPKNIILDNLANLLAFEDDSISKWVYQNLVFLGVGKEELLKVYLNIFKVKDYEGPASRNAVKALRLLGMNESKLVELFNSKFKEKYNKLPLWVRGVVNEEKAFKIFVEQGSLQYLIGKGTQSRSEIGESVQGGGSNSYEQSSLQTSYKYIYQRIYTKYYLENFELKEEFGPELLIQSETNSVVVFGGFSWSESTDWSGNGDFTIQNEEQLKEGDPAMLAPLSDENKQILDEAQQKFNLSLFDKEYLAQMWRQRLSAGTHARDPLKIILDRSNPQNGNFILASMLNDQERRELLGTTEYLDLAKDPQNALAAANTVVTLNSMDGGIGESVDRLEYLKVEALERARDEVKKRGQAESEITIQDYLDKSKTRIGYSIFIGGEKFEDVIRGAKGTDLKFKLTIQGQVFYVSVAEAKFLQLIKIAQEKKYADMAFQPLVNWQSRASYEKLLDQIYLYDRLNGQGLNRTYRQVMEENGVKILPMLEQADLPAIEDSSGQVSLNDNAPRQPGGHGQWGFYFLYQIYKQPVVNDGRDHIRVFYNGDNLNSRVNEHVAGVVARNKWPIVKLTTPATRIDKKGGKDGVRVAKIQQADGTFKTVYEPDQLEVADAKAAKQEAEFIKVGQINGLGEPGKQPFNTNIFYINEKVLSQILNKLANIIGEENLYQIISPILIHKPAKIKDGMSYVPVDGAIGTAMHSLNSYFMTTTDERVKAILSEFGLDRILYFVDVPRTEFFTPIKNNFDLTLQSQSDYYTFDQNNWGLQDSNKENVPPEITLLPENEKFWKEQQNHLAVFGNNLRVRKLESLRIQGKVLLPNAELMGTVNIVNGTDEIVDLYRYQITHPELFSNEHLVLHDVTLSIDRDTGQLTVSKNQTPDPAQLPSDVGGIDMNNIEVKKQGQGASIQFEPMDMDAIMKENIQGFVPVIINVTPVNSILPILGLEPPKNKEEYEVSQLK